MKKETVEAKEHVDGRTNGYKVNEVKDREKKVWSRRYVGNRQESRVQEFLQGQGYEILARNFYTRRGEIDLIAKKDGYLVFVEVKYRADERFGVPEEAVDYRKQKKIIGAARCYMYQHRLPVDTPCRFDVAGVLGDEIRITENAFWI